MKKAPRGRGEGLEVLSGGADHVVELAISKFGVFIAEAEANGVVDGASFSDAEFVGKQVGFQSDARGGSLVRQVERAVDEFASVKQGREDGQETVFVVHCDATLGARDGREQTV